MFSDAYTFMEESFAPDLDTSCLAEASIWEAVRNHPSIQHSIPIPSSNSPAAKRMRAAAALIMYSRALAKYIWRPTYITRETDLDKTLASLEAQDPLHEAYARAVLLKISPERQAVCRQSCIKYVVADFMDVMGCLVPEEHRDSFQPGLKQLSEKISDGWFAVQKLQEKVKPSFHFNYLEEWQPLPQTPSSPDQLASSAPGDESSARVVWPTFLYTNPDHETEELLHHGYTITYAQIGDAEKELSRRAVRKTLRLNEQAIAGNKKRRDSGIFLSHGPLLSSPVK
ncbi:hypothetical protein CDD81_4839 [Ophiocordyceps australis]|uniref:Uncharacterized protein n=1 Tax=Ophiocordyceps australis TaxID=1399860 RepID=A0A2C5Y405_9HYPO|nr:hypothetical protein CDD81_4839 [Ophiocordyceps australis]